MLSHSASPEWVTSLTNSEISSTYHISKAPSLSTVLETRPLAQGFWRDASLFKPTSVHWLVLCPESILHQDLIFFLLSFYSPLYDWVLYLFQNTATGFLGSLKHEETLHCGDKFHMPIWYQKGKIQASKWSAFSKFAAQPVDLTSLSECRSIQVGISVLLYVFGVDVAQETARNPLINPLRLCFLSFTFRDGCSPPSPVLLRIEDGTSACSNNRF